MSTAIGPVAPTILDRMSALADPVRCRLLSLLETTELTVSELCSIVQLPQSTVSRHLKILAGGGWVRARPEGTRRLYSASLDGETPDAIALWRIVRPQVDGIAIAAQDRHRLESVLSERRTGSERFFASAAGEWSQLRRELFGHRFDLLGLLALLDRRSVVGDLGSGTGETAAALSPFVNKVVAVDASDAMLEAARDRLANYPNIEIRRGRLEALPVTDGELDAAILGLVLHHMSDPERVLTEAARGLVPGGRLLVIDMQAHQREEYRQRMGHVWLGFDEPTLARWFQAADLTDLHFQALPADPAAKGPSLFVASAVKRTGPSAQPPSDQHSL